MVIDTEKRGKARTFLDLIVWRKAHEFTLNVYKFTSEFPKQETYGLTNQMRRAAVSIPSNIAEGFRRRGLADKARFMNMAQGSVEEVRYYLILAQSLKFGETEPLNHQLEKVSRLLEGYLKGIQNSSRRPAPDF